MDSIKSESGEEAEEIGVLLDKSNFYSEGGGQENDTGHLTIDEVCDIFVSNVQVYAGYVLHTGVVNYGNLRIGDEVICSYDETRRHPMRSNHTATHLLNFSLRKVFGDQIDQKGSLVSSDKFRFDYSCRVILVSIHSGR